MNDKVMVAMSGGVDSAAAALLIKKAGYDAAGITMKLWSETEVVTDTDSGIINTDIADAKRISETLSMPHYVLSLGDTFRACVIDKFISDYKSGATPNPCVECNRYIKFGKLLEKSIDMGYNRIATGHYARIERMPSGRFVIKKALDESKDQSYVLWSLSQQTLARTLLPLGDYTKAEIRELAAANGFINAHKSDSQDICFIPDGDYAAFICRSTSETFPDGNFVDTDGNILGRHSGIIKYTVGQRKGLGIALGKPMFVKEKDTEKNTVTLCENDELFSRRLTASRINFVACEDMRTPTRVEAKIRYKHGAATAVVTQTDDDTFTLEFDTPQRAIARGQSVVLYDGDTLVGGGIID
ncbi:MAG: tRNA 2-thiouridine(34) synthase MnmA [Clostridia bacterium]|nr:tRNA 2-thiouridine(34) synthase MnmA [Clostridia bacterium]